MFSFLRKEEPPLELYGKLPIAKDYLRVGCGSDAGRRLREWLDRGFAGELGGGASVPPYPMRFLWTDRAGALLQGTLRASADAGGLRAFPLVLFVERRPRALAEERRRSAAGDEGWWRALERCHAELAGFTEGEALLAALRGRPVTRDEPASEDAGTEDVGLDAWVESLWPGEGRPGIERLLRELALLLRESPREPIVRLPLAWGSSIRAQVGAWLGLLAELGRGKGRPPTVFYPGCDSAAPSPAFLLVLPASPEPETAGWLHAAPRTSERGDLVRSSPAPALPRGVPATPGSLPLAEALLALSSARAPGET